MLTSLTFIKQKKTNKPEQPESVATLIITDFISTKIN